MTYSEETKAKLAELRKNAEDFVKAYNEAYQGGKISESVKLEDSATQTVAEYNSVAGTAVISWLSKQENPMLEAVKMLEYDSIAAQKKKEDETGMVIMRIVDRTRQIDLYKLHKKCDGIGHDKNWIYQAEQFNARLTARMITDLNALKKGETVADIIDSYAMSNIAREINLGKNPCSNTQLLKTLQGIITSMLGEGYKATSHDVAYLKNGYAKKSRKALTLVAANHKALRSMLAEVCNHIVVGTPYGVEYKTTKG